MKRPWLVVALLLSVGINIGILAMIGLAKARGPVRWEPRMEGSGGPPVERLAERLGLEGDQRDDFVAQQWEFFESFQRTRGELELTRQELKLEVGSADPDSERIEELLVKSARLTATLDRFFIENVMVSRQILDRRQERLYFSFLDRLRRAGERWRGPERRP